MTDTHDAELLPCPFCGGAKTIVLPPTCHKSTPYDPADCMQPIVRCLTCYAEAPGKPNDGLIDNRSTKTAVEAWNTRAALSAMPAPKVKPLEWGPMEWEHDEYGCNVWGDFIDHLISLSSCGAYAIYRHGPEKFMWTTGTDTNIRYSTYRDANDPEWVPAIPWHKTEEAAMEAAQADYAARILGALV